MGTALSLERLIDEVRAGLESASALDRLTRAVDVAERVSELGENLIGCYVDQARAEGATWAEIGQRLGVSRQAVQKRFIPSAGSEHRPGFWDRASAGVKDAVSAAREEARRRRKTYLGTEHLLLGLTADPRCVASRALAACGADPDVVAAAVNGKVGVPSGDPLPDETPFTRLALTVLQHSLREALRTGGATVDTEHLALALLSVSDGVAHDVLINLGVSYDRLRHAVHDSR